MQLRNEHHTFTGMQRDSSISRHPSSFLYDAHNIRLTVRDNDTLYSITNERGTKKTDISVEGTYLGHCLLNNYLVVFSVNTDLNSPNPPDYINRIDLETFDKELLYSGNLDFSLDHPIEARSSYENESIQKVYWIDGCNQLRMINIVAEKLLSEWDDTKSYAENLGYTNYSFDSIPVLQLEEEITVSRMLGSSGEFASGVIQYAFTYYKKYGQETNIFYTSPLRFIAPIDRGGAPDEKVSASFEIKVTNVDSNFDFLRIYSIQRTSLNGTPICKRVVDIEIKGLTNNTATYIDTGANGDSIDPVELLYKGGEEIVAKAITQKDNTLFLGNFTLKRPSLIEKLKKMGYYDSDTHKLKAEVAEVEMDTTSNVVDSARSITFSSNTYAYFNQLSGKNNAGEIGVPCAGFKEGDTYRCGVQFQYKNGTWSNPFFIKDLIAEGTPTLSSLALTYPRFEGSISKELTSFLKSEGYMKARAVIVYPEIQDRATICQGVLCPTLYTENHREVSKDLLAQSSWFFRPQRSTNGIYMSGGVVASPWSEAGAIPYTKRNDRYNPESDLGEDHPYPVAANIRQVEVQGFFEYKDRFSVDWGLVTMHSPDIEFDSQLYNMNFNNTSCFYVGKADFLFTMSDIDIQTSTPTLSNSGDGFVHRSFNSGSSRGIISGLFYDDYAVDDLDENTIGKWPGEKSPFKWMVYSWQRSGALNNDMNRPTNLGNTSSLLKKKVISNLRYGNTTFFSSEPESGDFGDNIPELFSSDETTIIKVRYPNSNYPNVYQGNVDTILNSKLQGKFFAFDGDGISSSYVETDIDSTNWWKLYGKYVDGEDQTLDERGIYHFNNGTWGTPVDTAIGSDYDEFVVTKDLIRMKYKSTPHLVFYSPITFSTHYSEFSLPVVDIRRNTIDTPFGGTSLDALKANLWIPCGKAVKLGNKVENDEVFTKFNYNYGDTYYQRWDCLKTYPFTREDENQIVEIGSFPLQTHINIDGRYDKNRGQSSNLNMSPQNFNLLNPVYSQRDNFFTYRILDDDYYNISSFPNQITWSKEKQAGADIDLWANITLGSTYDMDGSKGEIVSLNTWKDQIFCFQNKGVSNILFNSRVQIPVSDGVPIEITNSYKVDGYRYIADGIGCDDKFQIKETPSGIYFINSTNEHLFNIGINLADITATHNMNSWFSNNTVNKLLYDDINHDLYLVNNDTALCFSEILGQFISFMDYGGISLIETYDKGVITLKDSEIYKLFEGQYNNFFGTEDTPNFRPWYFTFISNGVDNSFMDFDKIFTNIDYRMDMVEEGEYKHNNSLDYIQVTNEYQDTDICDLKMFTKVNNSLLRYPLKDKNLQKKFREWRIQIPRNKGTLDRIRNPWCKITLGNQNSNNYQAVLHDLNVQYYM